MSETALPRMALLILSYRQESFVADAVRGALAQTYPALDIVISDDASPDATWRVIEETAAGYGGPHRLILNRNPANLGLMGNLKHAARLTAAPCLVVAAADDISEPDRVARIAAEFARPQVTFVTSRLTVMDAAGRSGETVSPWDENAPITAEALASIETSYVLGCAAAYAREVFDSFPDFLPAVSIEDDQVLPFRALLLGRAACIPHSLVRYRQHAHSLTEIWRNISDPIAGARAAASTAVGFEQKIADLQFLADRDPARRDRLAALLAACRRSHGQALDRVKWETPGLRGATALLADALTGKLDLRLALKTFLRVHFARGWYRYVGWRGKA